LRPSASGITASWWIPAEAVETIAELRRHEFESAPRRPN
jgi:hypothetical protein